MIHESWSAPNDPGPCGCKQKYRAVNHAEGCKMKKLLYILNDCMRRFSYGRDEIDFKVEAVIP